MENECDLWIRRCDTAICMNLEMADAFDRGLLSVNILSQLRLDRPYLREDIRDKRRMSHSGVL